MRDGIERNGAATTAALFAGGARGPSPFPFRRAPASMLSLPGKTRQGFAEDISAAEEDGDLRALLHCRSHLVQTYSDKKGAAATRGDLLRAYVRELDAVAPRFDEAAGRHRLCFAWRDAGTIRRRTHTALSAERAVALFALATEQARAAAEEDRRGADGIRRACAALCDAAGLLRAASEGGDHVASCQLRHMSGACMAAFEALMLAQALECYFELAVAGGAVLQGRPAGEPGLRPGAPLPDGARAAADRQVVAGERAGQGGLLPRRGVPAVGAAAARERCRCRRSRG